MRLRSRSISLESESPPTPNVKQCNANRRRQQASKRTPSVEKQDQVKGEEPTQLDSPDVFDAHDVPVATRRPMPRMVGRKRALPFEDKADVDFRTPVRVRHQRLNTLAESQPATPTPLCLTARNIYSPIVRFLTPTKENVESPQGPLRSPEPCVFAFGTISPLTEEEDNEEVFSPFTFVKNIPSLSQHSRPTIKDIPPKTRSTPQATLVLDLDETLMFSSLSVIEDAQYTFHTNFQDNKYKVYVILRPYVKEFLQAMSKIFEMFIYTSAKKEYAENIVDILDPKRKLFRHRLYQQNCCCVLGHYVKDLSVLQRDPMRTVILDNAPHTYPYHLMNMIPVKSWFGEEDDQELQRLIPHLEKLAEAEDVREVLKRRTDHFHRLLSED
ncbi:CTD small phosphatase-like protein 3 [Clupea harengus]|uniref:CTD small phosphatase-like protein 3 n=1 Tax=Clupea harengus TaxID=7950 RepID=A0A8M1KC55_CLUHA|nr:CTD small phosphatase-like protein 3 [Clupea harengus]